MKKGDLYLISLPAVDGHEQIGARPGIVFGICEANMVIVVPCTSSERALRFPNIVEIEKSDTNGLTQDSVALLFQMRALDQRRLSKKIGTISDLTLSEMNKKARDMLSL